MINNNDITSIRNDFKLIFDNLIPGKELLGIKLEEATGKLSVLIKEVQNNSVYDIDFLSSGEKGLLLTLFLLKRTMANGGIVLLDEPELHLNPAVCKNIIPFLKKYICIEKNVQVILTSHSPEILTSTKEDDELLLLHLISDKTITPIYKKDNSEAQEALKCLGIKTADLLFNKGVIYLEGTTDEDFINEIFKGYISGFKIQSLGGRTIIEKEIDILQKSDNNGDLDGFHVFIIDYDNKPSKNIDTKNVKIIQWDRYSFENYLLNLAILYDVVKENNPKKEIASRAEFSKKVKELAFKQIESIAILENYGLMIPQSISLDKKNIVDNTLENISDFLGEKIKDTQKYFEVFDINRWKNDFKEKISLKNKELNEDWEENWKVKCKGKDLLLDVYKYYELKNFKLFIRSLIQENKSQNSEEWKIIKSKIEPIIIKN